MRVRMASVRVILCLAAAAMPLRAQAPQEPLRLTGYVEVVADRIELTVPDAGFSFIANDNIPLFQENDDYIVGIISGEAGAKRLVAVRRPFFSDPPVWVTKEGRMVFGREVSSCKGYVEFKAGRKMGVAGTEGKNYRLLLKKDDHVIMLAVPVKKRGLSRVYPIKPEWIRKPEPKVYTLSARTNLPAAVQTGAAPVEAAAASTGATEAAQGESLLAKVLQKTGEIKDHVKDQLSRIEEAEVPSAEEPAAAGEPAEKDRGWMRTLLAGWPYMLSLVFAVALLPLYRIYRKQPHPPRERMPRPAKEKKPRREKPPKKEKPPKEKKARQKKASGAIEVREEEKPPAPEPRRAEAPRPAPAATGSSATLPVGRREAPAMPAGNAEAETPVTTNFMIGRYQARAILGRGTMGIVYKAWQEDLKRTVALKVLKEGRHASMEAKLRFLREAQALARLRHPNIIAVYEVGEIDGQPFFSMDFVDGTSLDKLIMSNRPGIREAVAMCRRIAETVHYAHENGIIHRDLKPGNIIVDLKGEPVITDFGLARNLDSGMLSMSGDIIGTPSYMSPEQAQGKTTEVDIRTDVYSIGAVLYSLLTGKSPFAKASLLETLNSVINDPPEPIRRLNPQVDRELASICMKAMAKNKTQRYDSAKKMAEALDRYLAVPPLQRRLQQLRQILVAAFKKSTHAEKP